MDVYKGRYIFYIISLITGLIGFIISLFIYNLSIDALYPRLYYGVNVNHDLNKVLLTTVIATLIPLSIVEHLLYRRRVMIEDELPIFLSVFSDSLRTGMNFIEAWENACKGRGPVSRAGIKALKKIYLGVDFIEALDIFARELGERLAYRVASIIRAAYISGGRPVETLSIASKAYSDLDKFRKERLMRMGPFTYISYMSLLIFIIAGYILLTIFFPATTHIGVLGLRVEIDPLYYESVLFLASLIVAISSGLISSRLATGGYRAGVKHILVMFLIIYIVFFILIEWGIILIPI